MVSGKVWLDPGCVFVWERVCLEAWILSINHKVVFFSLEVSVADFGTPGSLGHGLWDIPGEGMAMLLSSGGDSKR